MKFVYGISIREHMFSFFYGHRVLHLCGFRFHTKAHAFQSRGAFISWAVQESCLSLFDK